MKTRFSLDPSKRRARLAGVAVLAALILTGCKQTEVITGTLPTDGYRTRYPIVITEAAETLDIPLGSGAGGLSQATRDRVRAFAADAAERGTGSLVVMTPSGSGNTTVAAYVARDIRRQLEAGGLPSALIEMRTYQVDDPSANAPLRLAYTRIKAVTEPCGRWAGSILPDPNRDDAGENFGCSSQSNLAAMVAEPTDLIAPRASTSSSAARRTAMMDAWRQGKLTPGTYKTGSTSAASGGL